MDEARQSSLAIRSGNGNTCVSALSPRKPIVERHSQVETPKSTQQLVKTIFAVKTFHPMISTLFGASPVLMDWFPNECKPLGVCGPQFENRCSRRPHWRCSWLPLLYYFIYSLFSRRHTKHGQTWEERASHSIVVSLDISSHVLCAVSFTIEFTD